MIRGGLAGTESRGGLAGVDGNPALALAKFWLSQAQTGIPAGVDIGALTAGLLKIAVAAGVATPSIAAAGTDYVAPDVPVLTSQAVAGLSAEVNLGLLASGLLKHAVLGGVSTPARAVPNTDYLAPGFDVVTVQTLGANAQTITVSGLTGNSYDVLELEFSGPVGVSGGVTAEINDNATPLTYGGSYIESGVLGNETTYLGQAMAKNLAGILQIYPRCTSRRMGLIRTVAVRESDTRIQEVRAAFEWANTADEITQIKLVGSAANYFSLGFKVTVKQRVLGA